MKIVAVMLVKNEDLFIAKAIHSIFEFADKIVVLDNFSIDQTVDAIKTIEGWKNKIEIHEKVELRDSHEFIQKYIGQDVFVFGVDGDEIYHPAGLSKMRERILTKKYEKVFQIYGQYLHAQKYDGKTAIGYLGPPSHTPTKLYNFKNLISWDSDFKHCLFLSKLPMIFEEWTILKDRKLSEVHWDVCPLKCIHLRFIPRSSCEDEKTKGMRLTGEDVLGFGSRADRGGADHRNMRKKYRLGDLVKKVVW